MRYCQFSQGSEDNRRRWLFFSIISQVKHEWAIESLYCILKKNTIFAFSLCLEVQSRDPGSGNSRELMPGLFSYSDKRGRFTLILWYKLYRKMSVNQPLKSQYQWGETRHISQYDIKKARKLFVCPVRKH